MVLMEQTMISVPKVGSSVTVTTQHKNVRLGEPAQIKQSYTGVVLNPEKWMIPSEFAIATGNKDFPRAIINSAYVVDIQYHKGGSGQVVDSNIRTFKITSKSSGKSYIVTAAPNQITCTCTGFSFRKTCKHSAKVTSFLKGN
jgi:hypothetical protein